MGEEVAAIKKGGVSSYCNVDLFREKYCSYSIQINQPTRWKSFTSLLLDVYMWLNMFRVLHRSSSGANNCTSILWFYRWKVVVGALLVVVYSTFICDSTCFGCFTAHHQEHTTALGASGFTVGKWWLERWCSWSGDHEHQRSNHHFPTVKPEDASAVVCSWWWAVKHPKHVEPHINVE
jgi:hypothetical protein